MQREDILFWTRARPFQPFRISMNSGGKYDVRHPEVVRIVRESLVIFTPSAQEPDVFDRAEMIGLNLIDKIEPIESGMPAANVG